jgi:hypothetical protein
LANFLSIFQTKPRFCRLFARAQQAFPATVLISAVSVRMYQLRKLKISQNVFHKKNLENDRSLCKGDGHEQLSDLMLGC